MTDILAQMDRYALAIVFFNVLLQQGGLPIPTYPTLILAGAILARPGHSALAFVAAGVAAAMAADSLWYLAGRRYGTSVLGFLCRVSLTPDNCVRQTSSTFNRYGAPSLLVAKFIPGFAAIAGALSGVVGMSYRKFLVFDFLGATLWVSVPIAAGYAFRSAIDDVLRWIGRFGEAALAIAVILLGIYIAFKWMQRQRVARELEMDRISVDQLDRLLRSKTVPTILDVRIDQVQSATGRIPGARLVQADRIDEGIAGLALTDEIVVYCSCPNEASAVTVSKSLRERGFKNVHPLAGGIDAWAKAGFSVDRNTTGAH